MKLVEVEPILGGEVLTLYYMSEQRIDFREMVKQLAGTFRTRIEMRQVGARDEARLVADYERCGQHCCCQNFLKVLKPVSMRSAKVQKATLDPLKISGRCGRLMCCLRYEDQTYKELKAKLPPRNKRVGTSEGPGKVVDSRILVQLVLVRLESDGREIAVPVEELMDPDSCPRPDLEPAPARLPDPLRGMSPDKVARRVGEEDGGDETAAPKEGSERPKRGRRKRRRGKGQQQDAFREKAQRAEAQEKAGPRAPAEPGGGAPKSKRRRRRRKRRPGSESGSGEGE